MWLIVGLGNPGAEYKNNRHNIGFMAAERIAADYGFPAWRTKYASDCSEGRIDGEKVMLLKPQTFMNLSGRGVGEAANFYKIPTDNIIVLHDELDLAPARMRVKKGGGAAGHNGLRSIDDWLPDQNYWRVRIGIGHPGDKAAVSNYVLGNFAKADQEWIDPMIKALSKHIGLMIAGKDGQYMTKVAQDIQPPKPKKTEEKKEQENGI